MIRVTGPSGTLDSTDKGLDYTADGAIRIIRYQENGTTITSIGLQDAKPGSYRVETLPGSAPITQMATAEDNADAKVTARVTGTGSKRTLNYDVGARDGQNVTFYDVTGGGAGKALKTIKGGGKGDVSWSPAPGRVGREVVARFELDGMPAEDKVVARFKPPAPFLGKPARLAVKRGGKKKSTLLVSWKKVKDATVYEVSVALADGTVLTKRTKSTKLTLTRILRSDSGQVAVVALAPMRHGKSAAKSFKRAEKEKTKFGDLKDCNVKKKKVSCR
jgi:hypothetical protein